jgi:hypothetical protein
MNDIFISYASTDRENAKRIAAMLRSHGWSVWWDRTIPPGRQFDEVIEEALDTARCAVVLWSPSSVESSWVKTEAAEAMRRRVLVPVLIEPTKIPLEFRRVQAANLSGLKHDVSEQDSDTRQQLDALLQSLSSLLNSADSALAALSRTGPTGVNIPQDDQPQQAASNAAAMQETCDSAPPRRSEMPDLAAQQFAPVSAEKDPVLDSVDRTARDLIQEHPTASPSEPLPPLAKSSEEDIGLMPRGSGPPVATLKAQFAQATSGVDASAVAQGDPGLVSTPDNAISPPPRGVSTGTRLAPTSERLKYGVLVLVAIGALALLVPYVYVRLPSASSCALNNPADAELQFSLAQDYEYGTGGCKKNRQEAITWLRKSAEQGNAKAQVRLGDAYSTGQLGLTEDASQAVEWFRKAAEQKDAAGLNALGYSYSVGAGGLPKDEAKAAELLQAAVALGDKSAQANLEAMPRK